MKCTWMVEVGVALVAVGIFGCGSDGGGTDGGSDGGSQVSLYWVESPMDCSSSSIRTTEPDEGTITDVLTLAGPDSIAGFAVDQEGEKIYFSFGQSSGNDTETLQRVNLDGSEQETLATYTNPDALTPLGVALDVPQSQVYWVAGGGCSPCPSCGPCSEIRRADLDGSSPETVKTLEGEHNPRDIALALDLEKVYWCDIQNAPHIERSNFDGSDTEDIFTNPGEEAAVNDIDVGADGKLYWLDGEDEVTTPVSIRRSNLDGSSPEVLFTVGGSDTTEPWGLAVDTVGGKIYWTEGSSCGNPTTGRVRRANLDGTDKETVVDELGVVGAIAIVR